MPQYQANDETLQFIYVDMELTIAVSTIETGLAILQGNHLYRRNEFPFMLMLSSGIERLLKIVRHLAVFAAEGAYRPVPQTHNLTPLREWVLQNCFTVDYLAKPNMRADRDYLAADPLLLEIFSVLTAFADARDGDRYLYMDAIVDPHLTNKTGKQSSVADRWPSRQWARLETICIDAAGGSVSVAELENQHRYATQQLVIVIERFMRIVGRLFGFGGLGDTGKQLSGYLSHFTRMDGNAFGVKTYKV